MPSLCSSAVWPNDTSKRQVLDETWSVAEKARLAAEAELRERMSVEERARKDREERAVWEQLAAEAESAKIAIAAQLQALQAAQAEAAAAELDIDEASTRTLVDTRLRARGWEVDTPTLRYSTGTRPAKGRDLAIAEWPTKSGPADYALFVGTRCIAVVEAKHRNKMSPVTSTRRSAMRAAFVSKGELKASADPGST